jgi:hypothetical protein
MYCLINEQECVIRFKATSALNDDLRLQTRPQIQKIYWLISILYIKNTNENTRTTTIDTALLVFFI